MDRNSKTKEANSQPTNSSESPYTKPIAENPNQRANENIPEATIAGKKNAKATEGVGSEITDGEDA